MNAAELASHRRTASTEREQEGVQWKVAALRYSPMLEDGRVSWSGLSASAYVRATSEADPFARPPPPNMAQSIDKVLADHELLAKLLLETAANDPAELARLECVCKDMQQAAQLVWLSVCARSWPQCSPADAKAARATCAAHAAALASCCVLSPKPPPRVDASTLQFTVHVSAGDGNMPLFVGGLSGSTLFRAGACRDDLPAIENCVANPPSLAVFPCDDSDIVYAEVNGGEEMALYAVLYVQRVRDGCVELACLNAGELRRLWDEVENDKQETFVLEAYPPPPDNYEHTTSFKVPLPAAASFHLEYQATFATCFDVNLQVDYESQPPHRPTTTRIDDNDDADAVDAPRAVARMRAAVSVETRFLRSVHESDCRCRCRTWCDDWNPMLTSPEDLAAALDSLTWQTMPGGPE